MKIKIFRLSESDQNSGVNCMYMADPHPQYKFNIVLGKVERTVEGVQPRPPGNSNTDVMCVLYYTATLARRDNSVLRQRTCAEQLSRVTSGDVIAELPPRLTGLWLSTRSV